jgi:predicted metal-binding membrane protein
MALLFVGGIMNVLWIAALSVLVLLEKILSSGRIFLRAVGLVLITAGAIFLYRTGM